MEVILFFVLVYAAKKAWDDSKKGAAKSRQAYMARAAAKHPGMPRSRQVAHAARHDAGHVLSQLFRGFPNGRHGFASGWHEGRQAHAHARAEHQRAKAEHLETRASLIPDLAAYRARQKAALERIRRGAGPDVKAVACKHAPGTCLTPTSCPCDCPDCMAAFNRQWEPPEEGSGGSGGRQPTRRVDGMPETDADRRFFDLRESGYDGPVDRDGNIPECWLCGLPVDGTELGASAHQRCLDVNDRDMERTEVRDSHPLEEVERDLREQGKCPYQDKPNDPNGAAIYCGQPIEDSGADEPDEFCPQHQAEAEGDYDRAAEEVHYRTRALLRESDGEASPSPSTTEGTSTMASEVTYDGVIKAAGEAVTAAEERAAEVTRSISQAEAQATEAGIAQRWADHAADQMQALNVDSATLGAMADHQDALATAEKAHQAVLEALEQARQAQARVTETAQNVESTLKRGHAGLAEAHQNAPVEAAATEFYETW